MWMQHIAAGVAALHSIGFIHKKLFPQNIIVRRNGNLAVTHPSLSSMQSHIAADHESTWAAYQSPEYQSATALNSPAIDVWSVGCIYFEMLSGSSAFAQAPSVQQVLHVHPLLVPSHAILFLCVGEERALPLILLQMHWDVRPRGGKVNRALEKWEYCLHWH